MRVSIVPWILTLFTATLPNVSIPQVNLEIIANPTPKFDEELRKWFDMNKPSILKIFLPSSETKSSTSQHTEPKSIMAQWYGVVWVDYDGSVVNKDQIARGLSEIQALEQQIRQLEEEVKPIIAKLPNSLSDLLERVKLLSKDADFTVEDVLAIDKLQ